MKSFLSQIKVIPTTLGLAMIILMGLFWLQEPDHPHNVQLSTAVAGMIGALITIGLFSGQQWGLKSFFLSVFVFTFGFTWMLSEGNWNNLMGFCAIFSLLSLMGVALTPYKRFGALQYP